MILLKKLYEPNCNLTTWELAKMYFPELNDSSKYNSDYPAEIGTYIHRLENYGFISTRKIKNNKGEKSLRGIFLTDGITDSFISLTLGTIAQDQKTIYGIDGFIEKNLKIIKDAIFSIPKRRLFSKGDIKAYIKNPNKKNNPLLIVAYDFLTISYVLHKEIKSIYTFEYDKKLFEKIMQKLGRKYPTYLISILRFSLIFFKLNLNYPHYIYQTNTKDWGNFFNSFVSLLKSELKTKEKKLNEKYWKKMVQPSIKLKKESLDMIIKKGETNLEEAIEMFLSDKSLSHTEEEIKKAKNRIKEI
jgi:hypothetical protein